MRSQTGESEVAAQLTDDDLRYWEVLKQCTAFQTTVTGSAQPGLQSAVKVADLQLTCSPYM